MKNIRIREMNDDERPVEKMIKKGVKYLNNSELLAILIRTGSRNDSAISLSTKILAKTCLLYTSPSPRDRTRSRMPSSA